ncbi:hypothetical protein F0344_25785 [Streptomyces finlayi]|uniref:NADP-dependent oxidoreductase domain-containing protein n=1 Tax=Streptomyces finlayi TaxID=67296 RepID=A0A7G7BQD5_9ACTN|nr:hypothetical protein [Streptomyces finlayi]QNE77550.1 hypothetical protein F0344_25785 [Streptomyces finlayi]
MRLSNASCRRGGSRWAPENIDALDFEFTEAQVDAIATLEAGTSFFFDHRDPEMVTWLSACRLDS